MNKVAFIFGCILLLMSCGGNDIEKVNILTQSKSSLPIETGKNVFINYTDSGITRAKVYAPLMKRYANDERNETEMPSGIKVFFFNRNRRIESSLKARYAIRREREHTMIARNDVILVNVKGDTLRTEELIWDERKQTIFSNKYVRITTPTEIITGVGFESNAEFTRYKINQISGTFDLSK